MRLKLASDHKVAWFEWIVFVQSMDGVPGAMGLVTILDGDHKVMHSEVVCKRGIKGSLYHTVERMQKGAWLIPILSCCSWRRFMCHGRGFCHSRGET